MAGTISDSATLYPATGVRATIFTSTFLFNMAIIYVLFFLGVREILPKNEKKYFVTHDIMVSKVCGQLKRDTECLVLGRVNRSLVWPPCDHCLLLNEYKWNWAGRYENINYNVILRQDILTIYTSYFFFWSSQDGLTIIA